MSIPTNGELCLADTAYSGEIVILPNDVLPVSYTHLLRNTYIYTETKKLIKKYGTRDPFEIMDQMNIVVGETSRYKTLKGYCFMSCKTIYVMISSFLSEEEKMIVAAHELGHIILHRSQLKMAPMQDDTLYNMTDNTEYQANLFAADLLIDDEEIEDMVQDVYKRQIWTSQIRT